MARQRKAAKSAPVKRKDGGLPAPYKRPPEVLQPIIDTFDEKHVYIMHIDSKPRDFKRKIFLVPVLMNLAIVALFAWRVYYISPYYLSLVTSAMGYWNETTMFVDEMTWEEIIPEVGRRTLTFMIDTLLAVFLWPWPIEFCFGQQHGNPVAWRRAVGFRSREVVVRRSRKWSETIGDVVNDGEDGTNAARSYFLARVGAATSPMVLGDKTGYVLMDGDWDLDWAAMLDATTMVDKKMAAIEAFTLVILLHQEEWGWLCVDFKAEALAQEDDRRRQVFAFRDALANVGKEDLFYRWIEIVQFESSQPGGFGPERQEIAAKQIRELFLKEGIDFDQFWKESRDISICAFCQYRISLRRPELSQRRLISVTSQCASNHDPSRLRQFRPFPSVAGGSSITSISPGAQSLTTTTNPKLQNAVAAYKPTSPSQPPTNHVETSTPSRGPIGGPVGGLKFNFGLRRGGDILDPHEAMARDRLLTKKNSNTLQPHQPQSRPIDPQVEARYVWDSSRQQAIERYLRAESAEMYGDISQPKRQPITGPALPLSRSDIGSNFSVRSELGTKFHSDHRTIKANPLYRRIARGSDSLLRKIPSSDAPQRIDPPSLVRRQPGIDQNSNSQGFVASSLTRSGAFCHPDAGSTRAESPSPSGAIENKRSLIRSPFSNYGKLMGVQTPGGTGVTAGSTASPPSGLDASEAARVHNAEIRDSSTKIEIPQEWGQLARKFVGKPSRESSFQNTRQSELFNSRPESSQPESSQPESSQPETSRPESFQPERVDSQGAGHLSPNPRAVTKNDIATDNLSSTDSPTSQALPRDGDYSPEKNRRWDLFEREPRLDKKRNGNGSRKASRFDDDDSGEAYDRYQEKRRQKELRKAQREAERTEPIPIILPELISITAFANALKIKPEDFLVQLAELGFEGVTLDSLMAGETAALVAQEYGYEPTVDAGDSHDLRPRPPPEDPSVLPSRPPVVTIMGHVDHGKTTILDYLRQSSVAAQEHGGITQHIGAFSVSLSSGKLITFLDTPGHAAFLTMRQRGANVTDIVVLVVAADDSVMPQTLEALKHARAAKVPIIVAINKIDKDGARIDAVKHDLANAGVEIEDFGGDVQVVCVSGKTGQGMDDLEENILTLSEILDHRAELDGAAEGWILESSLKPTGKVATVLVKRGTLRPGDYIAAGLTWAKIRQLRNEAGINVAEAPPGTAVEILGWKDLPAAGDQKKNAAEYEAITEARKALQQKRARDKETGEVSPGSTGGTGVQEVLMEEENGAKLVNFIVKGDVHGSVEAVCAAIQEIGNHEVRPRVLRSATGAISEFDVEHAATSKSVLINFATTTPGHVRRMAEEQGVRILDHTIIYHLIDDVNACLSKYLTPDVSTRVLGEAEVLQIFPINLRGRVYKNIAGCRVRNGAVGKNNLYRVVRRGETVFDGKLETLKQAKKDVMEMRKGTECGMGFEEFQDLEVGDQIQAYEEVRTTRSL
ncbi:hypothetical protein GQX73_g7000 [Xylaria multiplex]|uniref:Translation initiation factor IF-2, mitochondrial n=1 Tax=Xylaria multiplex TaxID=323545 RepID=A0A7C8MRZ4_9PEZI|nr:hypothetical protein GQX73_g7000 [Xylaria multiplex]